MKKILSLSLVLVILAATASAQNNPEGFALKQRNAQGFYNGQLTRPEKFELRKDELPYKAARYDARREEIITPRERRRLHRIKCHERRRAAFIIRHHRRHGAI